MRNCIFYKCIKFVNLIIINNNNNHIKISNPLNIYTSVIKINLKFIYIYIYIYIYMYYSIYIY